MVPVVDHPGFYYYYNPLDSGGQSATLPATLPAKDTRSSTLQVDNSLRPHRVDLSRQGPSVPSHHQSGLPTAPSNRWSNSHFLPHNGTTLVSRSSYYRAQNGSDHKTRQNDILYGEIRRVGNRDSAKFHQSKVSNWETIPRQREKFVLEYLCGLLIFL